MTASRRAGVVLHLRCAPRSGPSSSRGPEPWEMGSGSSLPTAMRSSNGNARSLHEPRQYEAYDPRRWAGAVPFTADEVGEIPAEYFPYIKSPGSGWRFGGGHTRNLALPLRRWAETDCLFIRPLPARVAGARITLRHSKEARRIVGWCAHECTVP